MNSCPEKLEVANDGGTPKSKTKRGAKLSRSKRTDFRQKLLAVNDHQNVDVPRVCIDMGMGNLMSEKEINSLVCQVTQVYSANRKAQKPMQLWLTNMNKEGSIYQTCIKKNTGFEEYLMNMTDEHYSDVFPKSDVIYLTPDAPYELTTVEDKKVYVIGGLVDEQVMKCCTYYAACADGVQTACLPIQSWMRQADKGTYSRVLTVNQVFDILLTFYNTNSWNDALLAGVPRRKGLVLR